MYDICAALAQLIADRTCVRPAPWALFQRRRPHGDFDLGAW